MKHGAPMAQKYYSRPPEQTAPNRENTLEDPHRPPRPAQITAPQSILDSRTQSATHTPDRPATQPRNESQPPGHDTPSPRTRRRGPPGPNRDHRLPHSPPGRAPYPAPPTAPIMNMMSRKPSQALPQSPQARQEAPTSPAST